MPKIEQSKRSITYNLRHLPVSEVILYANNIKEHSRFIWTVIGNLKPIKGDN